MSFENLNLITPILNALKAEGYEKPTPIQAKAIPIILNHQDLLGCAQTGTGKTAAFAIPILQLLSEENNNHKGQRKIRSLIVTPTRELAIQIEESFKSYGKNLPLKHAVIFGGVPQNPQVNKLKAGVDVLVATPGRLLDLIGQGIISLNHIEIFVLDEADRMLDMGFIHDIQKLLRILPTERQSLFFSATMPASIMVLASEILNDPEKVEVTPVSSTAETIQQEVYMVDAQNKRQLLVHVIEKEEVDSILVFTRTKHGADKIVKYLVNKGIKAEAIHGNKSQNARQKALTNFKSKETKVLIATDIAARGIDIDELAFVINYEIPNIAETYVHRIGRTGRAGSKGKAVSFCDIEELEFLTDIQKLISIKIPVVKDQPFPAQNLTPPTAKEKKAKNAEKDKLRAEQRKNRMGKRKETPAQKEDRTKKKKWSWKEDKKN
jgi:ATP-dependent RNA helicase RhlE